MLALLLFCGVALDPAAVVSSCDLVSGLNFTSGDAVEDIVVVGSKRGFEYVKLYVVGVRAISYRLAAHVAPVVRHRCLGR